MKVTVIDSSIEAAKAICEKLSAKEGFLTAYLSGSPENIFDKLIKSQPDVILLDIELANLVGIELLSNLMKYHPFPIVLTCFPTQKGKLSIVEGMEQGAVDFLPKPASYFPDFIDEYINELALKLRTARQVDIQRLITILKSDYKTSPSEIPKEYKKKVVVFGMSNCSTEAFRKILAKLPHEFPSVIGVLDMPGGFTKLFADRLNEVTELEVKEAIEKDELIEGRVIIAQGGFHLKIPEFKNKPFVEVFISEKVNHKRPSIDVLMLSVAEHIGRDAIGVLLSGTGEDGVVGLKAMKMSGADTIIIKPETAIISDRLQRAENFASHTHSVAYEDLPDLLMDLVQK